MWVTADVDIWSEGNMTSRSVSPLIFCVIELSEKRITQADWRFPSITFFHGKYWDQKSRFWLNSDYISCPSYLFTFSVLAHGEGTPDSSGRLKMFDNWMVSWVFLKNCGISTWWEIWYLFKNTLLCIIRDFFFFSEMGIPVFIQLLKHHWVAWDTVFI